MTSFATRTVDALLFRLGKHIHKLRDSYYHKKNINKPRVLVFTDSRGYEVTKAWNKKSAYASYVGELCKHYYVDYIICPEFSTTIVDFLYEYQQRSLAGIKYDAVIAHVGVVDFSPRPVNMLQDMVDNKSYKVDSLFSEGLNMATHLQDYHQKFFDELYFGKPVKNFYSKEFLVSNILPKLKQINNLLFIGCSPVLTDWHGNYWRERPHHMNMILDYSKICAENLDNFVDLSTFSPDEIKRYTIDNIHLSPEGFKHLHQVIQPKLEQLVKKQGLS